MTHPKGRERSRAECNFGWESEECCQLPFHRCGIFKGHEVPHRCACGQELQVGGKWVIGSSVDHSTGKPRVPKNGRSRRGKP